MAKASPINRSFNAGEWSPLLEGRVDIDKYPASSRELLNFILTTQGPVLRRSGTQFVGRVKRNDQLSALHPFIVSETEVYVLEFSQDGYVRFLTEDGLLVYPGRAVTDYYQTDTDQYIFTVGAGHGYVVGDQLSGAGFAAAANLSNVVLAVTGTDATRVEAAAYYGHTSLQPLTGGETLSKVYSIPGPYASADTRNLRMTPSQDVAYLFMPGYRNFKLRHRDTYDWDIVPVEYVDGPYGDVISDNYVTLSGPVGKATTTGVTASSTRPLAAEVGAVIDEQLSSAWFSATAQAGSITFDYAPAVKLKGYTIYGARSCPDTTYTAEDTRPFDFKFYGTNDGVHYDMLDSQQGAAVYYNGVTPFFELRKDAPAYLSYKLDITAIRANNGAIGPGISELVLTQFYDTGTTFTVTSTTGINFNKGFLPSDVGRLIRIQCNDGNWRPIKIIGVTNALSVVVVAVKDAADGGGTIFRWRLGLWSDTSGWPTKGVFLDDRLWLGGSLQNPDVYVSSVSGDYENMSPSDPDGVVQDSSAMNLVLTARRRGQLGWMETDDRGLLVGTAAGEWAVSSVDSTKGLTPSTARARNTTARGSAPIEAVKVDNDVVYVQRSKRTIRSFSYNYSTDGYKSPSLQLTASHLGSSTFEQIEYAAEPHSLLWVRRADGTLVALTYNSEESVTGWARFDFTDVVEHMAVVPSKDGRTDVLWLIVRRITEGVVQRYIERLRPTWEFDDTMARGAHFVDSGLRYSGDPVSEVFGLAHIEGHWVSIVADGGRLPNQLVQNGGVTLAFPASNIVVGKPYLSRIKTARSESGAADGTAQGKVKRIHNLTARVWDSLGGRFAVDDGRFEDLPYPDENNSSSTLQIYSGDLGPLLPASDYTKDGCIAFETDEPFPFNLVALMPQLNTQDR